MLKMAAVNLDAHPDSFDCGKRNRMKNYGIINVSLVCTLRSYTMFPK